MRSIPHKLIVAAIVFVALASLLWLSVTSQPDDGEATPPEAVSATEDSSASGELEDTGARLLRGRVTAEDGSPIAGASVRLTAMGRGEVLVTTGEGGEFEGRVAAGRLLAVTAEAEGYLRAAKTPAPHDGKIDIVLRKSRSVSGTVVAADGPVAGAAVSAARRSTTSEHEGAFTLEGLPAAPVSLTAGSETFRSPARRVDLSSGSKEGVVLRLEEAGALKVSVRSADGAVSGARVEVMSLGRDEPHRSASDESGVARFDVLAPGPARVVARSEGLAAGAVSTEVLSGREGEVEVLLGKAHEVVVRTTVGDEGEESTDLVHLRLVPADGESPPGGRAHRMSARIGEPAVFRGVAEGSWRAVAHHPTHSAAPVALEVPGEEATIVLEEGGQVAGTVVDGAGAPLEGAFVIASPALPPGGDRAELPPARRGRSDEAGAFEIEGMAPGRWVLSARLAGFSPPESVAAEPGQSDVMLRMSPAAGTGDE